MLLRPGGLPRAEIERVLGRALVQPPADAEADSGQPLAPGMLASHYAPRAKVRLNAVSARSPAKHCWRSASEQFRELTPPPR